MIDPVGARLWGYRALFLLLVGGLAVLRLLPLGPGPSGLPGPEPTVALAFAWVIRQPAYVPAWLIVAVFLPLDLLLHRPPGLGALTVLLGALALRRRTAAGVPPFPVEWALVAAVLLSVTALRQVVLALTAAPAPPIGLDLMQALFTAAVYPLVVAVSAWMLGVRRSRPGAVDARGARL